MSQPNALRIGTAVNSAGQLVDVKDAVVSASASGSNTIVPAVVGKKIVVLSYLLSAAGAVDVRFRSAANDRSGLLSLDAKSGAVAPYNDKGWFRTAAGEALNLNLSAAVGVGGHLTYIED